MKGYIQGHDWLNEEPMKYWSFPASTSDTTKKETVRNAIFSGDYIGALKVDGYYQRLLKDEDGNCFMIARSRNTKGEIVNKIDWVPQLQTWMDTLPNGTCFLAEAYLPNNEGSKNVTSILGCLKDKAIERQKTTPLHFHIFDCMAWNGEDFYDREYEYRISYVKVLQNTTYIHPTEFFSGEALWEHLQMYLADGREGMVIMRRDATVYNKRTPARISIKIKRELKQTIDCVVIGANPPTKLYNGISIETWQYWIHDVTDERLELKPHYLEYMAGAPIVPVTKNYYYKWAGSFKLGLFDGEGKMHHYGDLSGLTEEMMADWREYINVVVEVGGMMLDDQTRTIRHPKLIRIREDKQPSECTDAQLYE